MPRKKKISTKVRAYNVVLICLLSVFIIALAAVLVVMIARNKPFYKIESRDKQVEKNKQKDTDDYKTMGWVRIQGTNIDYPLYSITETSKEYPVNRSLLWNLNMDGKYHNVNVVYGHNIMNLSGQPKMHDKSFTRMEEMMSYVYYDFVKDNKYFQLTINGEDYLYKIFAVNFMDIEDVDVLPIGDYSAKEKAEYVKNMKENSIYDFDVDIKDSDDIGSVVTCTRFFGDQNYDFVITGRLVRKNEKVDNYSVYRNKKYVEISDVLKGEVYDDEDEYDDEEYEDEYESEEE